ncbi:PREDICTED: uncharacterized protein LOC107356242 [Acropora digitifera]|uniref:uncharacterized protein LOC107356242 n=1 Tax=Acropora digitifera TaxID=70779 RepID=UPI00077B14B3|nr:PREDICTED: uncharacterized protein LOC107356242 [Acropora digitifera]
MGARIGDGRLFKGRISCMQAYNGALSRSQLISKKRRCFRRIPVRPSPRPIGGGLGKKRNEVVTRPNDYSDHNGTFVNDSIERFYIRSDIAKVKVKAPSSFLNASHLRYFKSFGNNSAAIDQLRGCKLPLGH